MYMEWCKQCRALGKVILFLNYLLYICIQYTYVFQSCFHWIVYLELKDKTFLIFSLQIVFRIVKEYRGAVAPSACQSYGATVKDKSVVAVKDK